MQAHSETFQTEEISESNSTLREFIGFMRDLVIIFIIVIVIRGFVVTPFRINGSSMETSYHDKEYIIVDKFSYLNLPITFAWTENGTNTWDNLSSSLLKNIPLHVGDPVRGDVVVITPHVDRQKEYYIKRVLGLPGDTILFQDGEVLIKKSGSEKFIQISEPYLSSVNAGQTRLPENVKTNQFLIPEWYYWVMWDNRNNSADSRSCFRSCIGDDMSSHFIKRKDIVGKVLLNLWYYNIFSTGGLLDGKKWTWTYPPRFFNHPRGAHYPALGE
jgi:signal peptidase I